MTENYLTLKQLKQFKLLKLCDLQENTINVNLAINAFSYEQISMKECCLENHLHTIVSFIWGSQTFPAMPADLS